MYSYLFHVNFSHSFSKKAVVIGTGLLFLGYQVSPFLYMGVTIAFFWSSGKTESKIHWFETKFKGSTMIDLRYTMAHEGTLPAPSSLLPFSPFLYRNILFEILDESKNSGILVTKVDTDGEVDLEQNKLPRFWKKKIN